MSGSTSFKFKKPINWAYAPGLATAGIDGSIGNPGADGNAIYFIDYELDNSYNIELAQQKLENNFTLSGNSLQISEKRKYHSGDIIISNAGNCYRIEKGVDPYYTYSIEYIGRLSVPQNFNINFKILGLVVIEVEENNTEYRSIYQGFVPNNRQILKHANNTRYIVKVTPDMTVNSNNTEVFEQKGIWYKFLVLTDELVSGNIDFTVEVKLKNKKSYNLDAVSSLDYSVHNDPVNEPLHRIFNFNKTLEFPAPAITREIFDSSTSEELLSYQGDPYFLSDFSMDKVHLFGNDIKMLVCTHEGALYASIDGETSMKRVYSNSSDILQRHALPGKYWPHAAANNTTVYVPAVYSSFKNGSLQYMGEDDINWRGGESAYFSSITINERKREYMRLFMHDAEFNVIMHNNDSGEIKTIKINNPIFR